MLVTICTKSCENELHLWWSSLQVEETVKSTWFAWEGQVSNTIDLRKLHFSTAVDTQKSHGGFKKPIQRRKHLWTEGFTTVFHGKLNHHKRYKMVHWHFCAIFALLKLGFISSSCLMISENCGRLAGSLCQHAAISLQYNPQMFFKQWRPITSGTCRDR